MPLHLFEQPPAQIMLLEQMAEAAHRRFVGHRLAAEIDPDKTPHRRRIVERLFDRRVRQVEPLLQEIDAQHPLDTDRRTTIARFGIKRFDQRAQRRPRHNAPSQPETQPVASSWRSARTPLSPASAASLPPTYAQHLTPLRIISRSLADRFCRPSLGVKTKQLTP